jgi:hypothetical protein
MEPTDLEPDEYESTSTRFALGWSTWLTRRRAVAGASRAMTTKRGPYWSLTFAGALRKSSRIIRRDRLKRLRELSAVKVSDSDLREWLAAG